MVNTDSSPHTLSGQQIKQYARHEYLFLIISILFLIITTILGTQVNFKDIQLNDLKISWRL
jgi:hypothetical protein